MTPESRLRARTRLYLRAGLIPPAFFSAIEHARRFQGDPVERMKQAAWWKAQGVLPGIADIVVWGPGLCCGIELKVKGNKPTPAEIAFGEAMHACGHHWLAAWSVVEVDAGLRRIGFNLARSMAIAAQGHDLALTVPEAASKPRAPRPEVSGEELARASRERLQGWLDE